MHIDPAIAALQADPAAQRRAQAALEEARDGWRSGAAAAVLAQLAHYGDGAPIADCPALDDLFAAQGAADQLVTRLVQSMQSRLRAYPLGQVPLRHQYSGGIATLQLAEAGRATLSLITYEHHPELDRTNPATVCFADGERHEFVLAGSGRAQLFEMIEDRGTSAVIDCEQRSLAAGDTLALSGPRVAKQIVGVAGRLSILRLARCGEDAVPSREFRIADGALVHRASGKRSESREELAMALLARMGRSDAAPAIADVTRSGSDHLRWQALRSLLTLDTARGFAELSNIARDPADGLSSAASALRAQLIEAHPQLANMEDIACPA